MSVYISELDYHYFKLGSLCIAYEKEPFISSGMKKINIMKTEIVKHLDEKRLLLKKAA